MHLFAQIKGHMALALVESIFRRAGFTVSPVDQREVPPHLGREDLPDFSARRVFSQQGQSEERSWLVEVRYRPDVDHYLGIENQRGSRSVFAQLKRHWPRLIFVFFTDFPESGRSCFQAVDLEVWTVGVRLATTDLFAHPGLDIFRQNVEEHEMLVRRMLTLFWGSS